MDLSELIKAIRIYSIDLRNVILREKNDLNTHTANVASLFNLLMLCIYLLNQKDSSKNRMYLDILINSLDDFLPDLKEMNFIEDKIRISEFSEDRETKDALSEALGGATITNTRGLSSAYFNSVVMLHYYSVVEAQEKLNDEIEAASLVVSRNVLGSENPLPEVSEIIKKLHAALEELE